MPLFFDTPDPYSDDPRALVEELQQTLADLEIVLDSIRDAVFIHDLYGRILSVNAKMLQMYGVARHEAPGYSITDDYSCPKRPVERLAEVWPDVLRGNDQFFPWTARRPHDGSTFPVEVDLRRISLRSQDVVLATVRDLTDRIQTLEKLELAARVFENAIEGITVTDATGSILMVNRAFSEITGYAEDEVLGSNPRILKSDRHDASFYRQMWDDLLARGAWEGEIWNRRKNGEAYPEWLSISAILDLEGEVSHFVAIFHDISEVRRKDELIHHQAYHDALTGLPNRLLLRDRLGVALSRAQRKDHMLAVVSLDLDHFKNVNDSLGHAAGDMLLRQVAERLTGLLRDEDTVAHSGADEFALVLQDVGHAENAVQVATKIKKSLAAGFRIDGRLIYLSASAGVSLYPYDGGDAATLLRNANSALHRAKEAGGDCCRLFTSDMNERVFKRLLLENSLRQAIEQEDLVLHYQPKVELVGGRVTGMEALVRWPRPDGTLIAPGDFIPIAEETGLIVPLGEWVLRTACRQARQWHQAGFAGLKLSVNLSSRQVQQEDIAERILAILAESGLAPQALELEITESLLMSNMEVALRLFSRLAEAGLSFSLDDFGTGYSSLYYLKRFPIAALKIDRSFVMDLHRDPDDAAIVRAILSMARDLRLRVIAEGVETAEHLQFLRDHGCDEIQGFFFSRPLPAQDFRQLLQEGRRLEPFGCGSGAGI